MTNTRSSSATGLVAAAAVLLAACASTRIVNQWSNPEYTGPAFKKVVVFGVSRQASQRRTFEDEFVAQLRAVGVDAVPSYQLIPEDGPIEEAKLQQAVRQAGAQGAIVTRLVKAEQRTQIAPAMYPPAPVFGLYGWYSAAWVGYYEPPQVYQYEIYSSETSLYDTTTDRVVWSGMAETTAPGDFRKEAQSYAKLMIDALRARKLI